MRTRWPPLLSTVNNGVEVTHAETFVHSGEIPVIPVSSKEEKNLKVTASLKNGENRTAKLI